MQENEQSSKNDSKLDRTNESGRIKMPENNVPKNNSEHESKKKQTNIKGDSGGNKRDRKLEQQTKSQIKPRTDKRNSQKANDSRKKSQTANEFVCHKCKSYLKTETS